MKARMGRVILPAILAGLTVVGCSSPADQRGRYDAIKVGMSAQDVERQFGPIKSVQLSYERSGYVLALEDGRLNQFSRVVTKPVAAGQGGATEAWAPLKLGMSRDEIVALLGAPSTDCATYPLEAARWARSSGYTFCFGDGKVVSKAAHEVPRLEPNGLAPELPQEAHVGAGRP